MIAGTLKGVVSQRLVPDRRRRRPRRRVRGPAHDRPRQGHDHQPEQTGRLHEVIEEGEYYGMQTFDQALLGHLQAGRDLHGDGAAHGHPPARLQAARRRRRSQGDLDGRPRGSRRPHGRHERQRPERRSFQHPLTGRGPPVRLRRTSSDETPKGPRTVQTTLAQFNEVEIQDAVLAPELQAAEGRARPGHDPGQARLDGRLPGRRDLRARRLRRHEPDAQEGRDRRGPVADEDDGQRRGVPGRHRPGHPPDLPRGRQRSPSTARTCWPSTRASTGTSSASRAPAA